MCPLGDTADYSRMADKILRQLISQVYDEIKQKQFCTWDNGQAKTAVHLFNTVLLICR